MKKLFKASIVLEDGKIFKGISTKKINCIGEIVFTTSMTGYQKALTDPSYRDQILVMTYPIQGNYGTNDTLNESDRIQVKVLDVDRFGKVKLSAKAIKSLVSKKA